MQIPDIKIMLTIDVKGDMEGKPGGRSLEKILIMKAEGAHNSRRRGMSLIVSR